MYVSYKYEKIHFLSNLKMKLKSILLTVFYLTMLVLFSKQLYDCVWKVLNPSVFQKVTNHLAMDMEVPAMTLCRKGLKKENVTLMDMFTHYCNQSLDCIYQLTFKEQSDFFISVKKLEFYAEKADELKVETSVYTFASSVTWTCASIRSNETVLPGKTFKFFSTYAGSICDF